MDAPLSTSTAVATRDELFSATEQLALAGFLAGYSGLTRDACTLDLRQYVAWCTEQEGMIAVSPAEHVRRVNGLPENYFDHWVAQHYEVLWPHLFDPEVVEPAVSFLADLAGDGRALELGIGTGRLALPLSRRGIRVDGIELSAAMVEQLHSQPGSSDIDVTIGDFSTTKVSGTFTLAYLVRNTIMNLTTQDAQVECFLNVARHLEAGGFFVIEVIVPPWQRLAPGETVIPFDVSPAHLGFDEIDVATQNSWSHHYWFVDGETKTFSAPFRNVWPSELDLMARLAGMVLRDRWSDWNREPFTSKSGSHISVWQKPA